jgi:hypothetical protein
MERVEGVRACENSIAPNEATQRDLKIGWAK